MPRLRGAHAPISPERQDVTQLNFLSTVPDHAVEALLDEAFGVDRHGRTAYAIRTGMRWLPELSYALSSDEGTLLGLLQSWPVALKDENGAETPLIMIGPVAVLPTSQGEGHGRTLMDRLVVDTDANSALPPLMMIGDPEYYGRFWGFSAEEAAEWAAPGPIEQRRLLVRNRYHIPLPKSGILGPRTKIAVS